MLERYDIYEFTGKKLQQLVGDTFVTNDDMFKAASKFAKRHGADTKNFLVPNGSGDRFIQGFKFDKAPPEKLWKKVVRGSGCWVPKKNTRESKKLHDEMKKIPTVTMKEIQKAVGWKLMSDPCTMKVYFFSSFSLEKLDGSFFCGMRVPVLSGEGVSKYEPARGMKLISHDEYQVKIAKIEKDNDGKQKRKKTTKRKSAKKKKNTVPRS